MRILALLFIGMTLGCTSTPKKEVVEERVECYAEAPKEEPAIHSSMICKNKRVDYFYKIDDGLGLRVLELDGYWHDYDPSDCEDNKDDSSKQTSDF